jgi:hypothetical protein
MDSLSLKRFAECIPFLLSIAGIGGFLFGGFVISRWDYSVRGLSIAIPFVIAAVVLTYLFRHLHETGQEAIFFPATPGALYRLYAVTYAVSIILLIAGLDRHYYLITVMVLFLVLFAGIFSHTVSVRLTSAGSSSP